MDRDISNVMLSRSVTAEFVGSLNAQPMALMLFGKQSALLIENAKVPVQAAAMGISLLQERFLDVRPPTRWGINE